MYRKNWDATKNNLSLTEEIIEGLRQIILFCKLKVATM
jgi:hypothetical protein